jgi:hypothetical protein
VVFPPAHLTAKQIWLSSTLRYRHLPLLCLAKFQLRVSLPLALASNTVIFHLGMASLPMPHQVFINRMEHLF